MHALLGERLDALYRLYGPETAATDPILFVGRYTEPEDQEVAGWIASAFAYGQVPVIQANVGRLLAALGARPARALDAVRSFGELASDALAGFRADKDAFFRAEADKALRAEWTLPPKRRNENARLLAMLHDAR